MSAGVQTLSFVIPGQLKGKGRPRAATRGRKGGGTYIAMLTPETTENAEAHVKQCFLDQVGQPVLDGPLTIDALLQVAVPPSWPKKRQAAALAGTMRPTGKPDLDNCVKLLCDALNGLAWRDDAQVVGMRVRKVYAAVPRTEVTIAAALPSGWRPAATEAMR